MTYSGISPAKNIFGGAVKPEDKPTNDSSTKTTPVKTTESKGGYNFGADPAVVDKEQDVYVADTTDTGKKELGSDYNTGSDNSDAVQQQVLNTDSASLDETAANTDFSKTGRFGTVNNMPYNETLAKSREVDAYNNQPVDTMMLGGTFGAGEGSYSLGTETAKYTRPKVETEESRLMRNNEAIDKDQRELDVQFQNLLNKKNYDGFMKLIEQKYNLAMSDYDKRAILTTFKDQQNIQTAMSKYIQQYTTRLKSWYGVNVGSMLYKFAQSDPLATTYMAMAFGFSGVSPDLQQVFANQLGVRFNEYADTNNMSPQDRLAVLNYIQSMQTQRNAAIAQGE